MVKSHIETLTEPTKVEGEIEYRDQAETGRDLWNLSGRQTDAIDTGNGKLMRIRGYIEGLAHAVMSVEQPACKPWQVICRIKNAD